MTTRHDLLQAIIAAPDEDAPRLVYADFLEETGNDTDMARARLIRVQIETARLPDGHPDKTIQIKEAVQLTDRYKAEWFGWVRDERCLPYPERGFLAHWSCGSNAEHWEDLKDGFRHEPITDVTLFPNAEDLPVMAGWPQLARVHSLKLWPKAPHEEHVLAFLSSPHLSGLRRVEYMSQSGIRVPLVRACRLLAERPQFGRLSSLSLSSAAIGPEGMAVLAGSETLAGLRTLTFEDCEIGNGGVVALADSRTLVALQKFALHSCGIGLAGCRALLASPVVAGLTLLNLGGNIRQADDGEEFTRLLAISTLPHLEFLVLDETAVNDRAASWLAQADWPAMKRLIVLPWEMNQSSNLRGVATMTSAGVRSLANSSWFRRLESLDLSGHPIGDDGAAALAEARLPNLRELTLMQTGLTATGLTHLVRAYSGTLRLLQLYGNPVGDAGARVVAAASWPQMATWDLNNQIGLLMGGCNIGSAGVVALLGSETIPTSIPELFLGQCEASPRLLAALGKKYQSAKIHYG